MSAPLEFEVADGVALATLNRPESFNSLDLAAAEAWQSIAHEAVDRDDIAVLVIAARGRAFSAGGDLRAMSEGGGELVARIAASLHDGILTLVSSSIPVVAAVTGTVAGGGLGLLLSSDYAVASDAASISARYGAMGLTPDMSVTGLLGRAVGERRALELVLRDRALTAAEALDWGLVAEVLPVDDVLARSLEVAAGWAANAEAMGESKRLLRAAAFRGLAAGLDDEAATIARLFDSEASRARVGRFLARSAPRA